MKVKTGIGLVSVVILVSQQAFSTFAAANGEPLTLQKIDDVWNAYYEYSGYRCDAFRPIIEQVGWYASTTTDEAVVAFQESVMSKVFSMRVGTLEDREMPKQELPCEIYSVGAYLVSMSRWPSMCTNKNQLLRVADNLARYKFLPDLSQTDAIRMAFKIDDYLMYGTNKPPFKAGWCKMWQGPVSEIVYKTADFRRVYNSTVKQMKERVFRIYGSMVLERGFRDLSEEDRKKLWQEFLRRAGVQQGQGVM